MLLRHNIILVSLFLLLLFVGLWRLPHSPATWFDEGINLGIAKAFVEKGVWSLEVAPDTFVAERQFLITSNFPALLPSALSLKLFGMNLTAARAPMVLFLLAFAAAVFTLALKLYSREAAIMSLALIVTFLPLYGNGKNVLGEIPGLFYFLCALLLLPAEFHFKRILFTGFFAGLAAATKPFFLVVPVALFLAEAVTQRGTGMFWKRMGLLALGMALPLFAWVATILPSFTLEGVSSTFMYYGNSYASSEVGILIWGNLLRFFTESTPFHFSLLFLAAAVFIFLKKKKGERITEAEIILCIFTLLTLLFYLKTPGWYRYFFPAHVLLFIFFPAALFRVFPRAVALTFLTGLVLVQTTLLVSKRNDPLYNSAEAARFAELVLARTPLDSDILFLNAPSAAFLIKGRESYQYLQINPERHIGHASHRNKEGTPFSYMVVGEPLPETVVENIREALAENYERMDTVGHLTLYKLTGGHE